MLGVAALAAAIGLIGCIIVAIGSVFVPHEDTGDAAGALYECREAATARLVAPSTAKFAPLNDMTIWETNQPGDSWGVMGYVDAQNRFGAMVRMHYLCTVRYDGDGYWILTEFDFSDR